MTKMIHCSLVAEDRVLFNRIWRNDVRQKNQFMKQFDSELSGKIEKKCVQILSSLQQQSP